VTQLATTGLTVSLGGHEILRDVSCSFETGEFVALIGPNGAGKSTLLKSLAGLQDYSGQITLDRQSLGLIERRERARTIGYLGQSGQAHWPISVEALVSLGRLPFGDENDQNGAAAIETALADCDLLPLRHRAVTALSGGERARVLLARVLAGQPKILLADEPVAGLDPTHQLDVMTTLHDKAAGGAAVIVVLHDLSLAVRFAERIILLHNGVVAANGTPDDVITPENLADCYGIEAKQGLVDGIPYVLPASRI